MRMNRFFIETTLAPGELEISDPRIVHQCKTVLRIKEGAIFVLFNGDGTEWQVIVRSIKQDRCIVFLENQHTPPIEPKQVVHAGIAILKKENFELVVQKLTELGIASITPIISERTIKTGLNNERIKKIIIEAAEQSGRVRIPALNDPYSVTEFIQTHPETIVFQMESQPVTGKSIRATVSFLIGPEGGWSPEEQDFFSKKNLPAYSLGHTTLRAETAAIVASYALLWK